MGGRGALSDATPSLPVYAGQTRSIRLFAGVCGLGLRFAHLAGPTVVFPHHPTTLTNPNKTRGGIKLASFPPITDLPAFYADLVNSDRYLPVSAISNTMRDAMLARGLVTAERLRERGVR